VSERRYQRVNIYLDSPDLKERIKLASTRTGVTVSEYCQEAIRRRLSDEGLLPPSRESAKAAAKALDRLRGRHGRLGVPVRDLIADGRRR
jgi:predicted DNA-binding protein